MSIRPIGAQYHLFEWLEVLLEYGVVQHLRGQVPLGSHPAVGRHVDTVRVRKIPGNYYISWGIKERNTERKGGGTASNPSDLPVRYNFLDKKNYINYLAWYPAKSECGTALLTWRLDQGLQRQRRQISGLRQNNGRISGQISKTLLTWWLDQGLQRHRPRHVGRGCFYSSGLGGL